MMCITDFAPDDTSVYDDYTLADYLISFDTDDDEYTEFDDLPY